MFIDQPIDNIVLLVLVTVVFFDYFSATIAQSQTRGEFKKFYDEYGPRMWLPPRLIFPFAWTIIYILIVTGMYNFYKELGPGDTWTGPTIFILFMVNIVANKQWTPIFVYDRNPVLSFILILVILSTILAMMIIFGINEHWISLATFVFYFFWCIFASCLNATVISLDRRTTQCSV